MSKQDQPRSSSGDIDKYTKHLWDLRARNKELLNRNILTLSTALLSLPFLFFRDPRVAVQSAHFCALKASWVCLVVTIGFTLGSFFTGQKAIDVELVKSNSDRNVNRWTRITDWLDLCAMGLFFFSLILIVIFLWNVQG